MDTGSTAWILVASALVLLMTPGLAFFYGGLVRAKNAVSTIMYSFIAMAVASIVWVLWGYSLAFSEGSWFVGGLDHVGLSGIGINDVSGEIPTLLFVMFQGMFAIITPALITGAFVERFKFSTYLIFLVLWVTLVYAPICHWVWGGGWIGDLANGNPDGGSGALDFAGGTVVHINAGIAAVAAAFLVGKRKNPGVEPHNVPYVVFHFRSGKMSAVGVATGAVAGLVAITPASGYVGVMGALAIGAVAGLLCFVAVEIINRTSLDDALDVFAVHGIGGIVGALLTGVFAVAAIGGTPGLIEGNGLALQANFISVIATLAYSLVATLVILKVLDLILGCLISLNKIIILHLK